jgi:hypothetical protein
MAARITTLLTLIISVAVFLLADEASVAFYFNVLAIILFCIAWFWHTTGGILITLLSIWALCDLLSRGYETGTILTYSMLFSLFLAGGVLYLFAGLRGAKVFLHEA